MSSAELIDASLRSIGDSHQQVKKIKILLRLAKQDTTSIELKRKYFNSAVEIARRYLGEDYQNAVIQARKYLREDGDIIKEVSMSGNYTEDIVSTYIKDISHDNLASIPKNLYPDIYEGILHRQLKEKEKVLKEIRE